MSPYGFGGFGGGMGFGPSLAFPVYGIGVSYYELLDLMFIGQPRRGSRWCADNRASAGASQSFFNFIFFMFVITAVLNVVRSIGRRDRDDDFDD